MSNDKAFANNPGIGMRLWPTFPSGAVGTAAALLAGMLGLAAQAQVPIEPTGTTLDATWQGGSGNAPFNWNSSPNWVGNQPPTRMATFPQLVNPANAQIRLPSNGNLTSIATLNFSSIDPNPTPYLIILGQGSSHFDVTGQGVIGSGQAAATFDIQPSNITSFQNASTGGLATFIIREGGTLDLSNPNRNPGGLNTMTTGPMTNGGTINLGIANVVGNRLAVIGNYTGATPGRINLNTFLGTDNSPTDRLIVSGGLISGNTVLNVTNVGGPGARTTGNGIRVVTATNGALSTTSAFTLSGRVAAGAFEYRLERGGFTRGTGSNWYLRNTLSPIPPVPPDPGPGPGPGPGPDGGNLEEGAADAADAASVGNAPGVPLYRPEVALHAVIPSVARTAVRATLGTFHDREGETAFASGDGAFKAGWARLFGGSYQQSWGGDVSPSFNGSLVGVQVGLPMLGLEHDNSEKDRAGLFFGYASAGGNVSGFARGEQGTPVGSIAFGAYSIGAYWTHFWPGGGYLDGVLMLSWIGGTTQSSSNIATRVNGWMGTASLELGFPIALPDGWAIEPQAQGIFQRWNGEATQDVFSNVSSVQDDSVIARFGLRFSKTFVADPAIIKPFAQVNLWQNFSGLDTITFGTTTIGTPLLATAMEFAGGVTASISHRADVYAKVSYTTAVDGNMQSSVSGRAGFRLIW